MYLILQIEFSTCFGEKNLVKNGEVVQLAEEIEEIYIKMDRFLGDLIAALDPNVDLVVFSDHGFTSYEYSFDINRFLIESEYMKLEQSVGSASNALFADVNWDMPRDKAVDDSVTSDIEAKGTGFALGVAYTSIPFINIFAEFQRVTIDELDKAIIYAVDEKGAYLNYERKRSSILVGVSAPFDLDLF